jgi:hypothetical protein
METAQQLDFKLYLEGVPTPFEAANITSQIGSPAMARISLLPTVKSQNILPRTSVHLFYADSNSIYGGDAPEKFAGSQTFRLLFEGEVMGLSYSKSSNNRSTSIICSDVTNNFDYAHRYVIEDIPAMISAHCTELTLGQKANIAVSNEKDVGLNGPISKLVAGRNDIVEGVKELIKDVFIGNTRGISTNEFLESVENRFKITSRITSIQDNDIGRLAEIKNFLSIMSRGIGRTNPNTTLNQLLDIFLGFIFYNKNSILSPSFNNSKIQSFILSPNIYFSPPPRCNVLFPEHVENIGYSDMFLQSPTRLFLQTSPLGEPQDRLGSFQCANTYVAPRELAELLPSGGAGKAQTSNNNHRVLTSEERIKGIIPVFKSIGQPEYVTLLGQRNDKDGETVGQDLDSNRNYLLNMAEYELEIRKAATRSVDQMSGPFNPGVIIGAPIVILDDVLFIFGILEAVTHTISASSGVSTSYRVGLSRRMSLNFNKPDPDDTPVIVLIDVISNILKRDIAKSSAARSVDDLSSLKEPLDNLVELKADQRIIDLVRKMISSSVNERDGLINQFFILVELGIFEELPETPRWVNRRFDVNNAGQSYSELYGCQSIMEPLSPSEDLSKFNSASVAASELFNRYKVSEDKVSFAKRYTARSNIVTQLDFNKFYKLPDIFSKSKSYPAQGPFTEVRQKPIKNYIIDLLSNRAHPG